MANNFMATKQFMVRLGNIINKKLPEGFGYCLVIFPFSRPGIANYVSNADRETMILALKEKIKVLESKSEFENPSEN